MFRVTQHIPGYCDGIEPHRATVASLDEFLALPWIQSWAHPQISAKDGIVTSRPFIGWRRSTGSLLALYGEAEDYWWVVAHAPSDLLAPLPEWHISPAGQASVDRWNRGDTSG